MRIRWICEGPSSSRRMRTSGSPVGPWKRQTISTPGSTRPVAHRPAELAGQPAHQHPRLHDGMRAVLDANLVALSKTPRSSAPSRACVNMRRQYFRRAPVDVRGDAPAPGPLRAFGLLQPARRPGHAARRVRPAHAVVDNLLGVLGQFVEQSGRRTAAAPAPPTTGSSANRRSAARAPRTANDRTAPRPASSVTCSEKPKPCEPMCNGRTSTVAVNSVLADSASAISRRTRAGWT